MACFGLLRRVLSSFGRWLSLASRRVFPPRLHMSYRATRARNRPGGHPGWNPWPLPSQARKRADTVQVARCWQAERTFSLLLAGEVGPMVRRENRYGIRGRREGAGNVKVRYILGCSYTHLVSS